MFPSVLTHLWKLLCAILTCTHLSTTPASWASCLFKCMCVCVSLLVVDFYLQQELLLQVVSGTEQAESHYRLLINLFFLGFLVFEIYTMLMFRHLHHFVIGNVHQIWNSLVQIDFDFHHGFQNTRIIQTNNSPRMNSMNKYFRKVASNSWWISGFFFFSVPIHLWM